MADLVLYDGVCGLCNRFVRFLLRRDRQQRFVFASLQSALAEDLLTQFGKSALALDTVYLLAGYGAPGAQLLSKGRAVLHAVAELGGAWGAVRVLGYLPDWLLDGSYDFVARRRYRWFGRSEVCPVPPPAERARFVDLGEG